MKMHKKNRSTILISPIGKRIKKSKIIVERINEDQFQKVMKLLMDEYDAMKTEEFNSMIKYVVVKCDN